MKNTESFDIGLFYISTIGINLLINFYQRDVINIKGGRLTGESKDIITTIFIITALFILYRSIKYQFKINNKFKSNFQVIKSIIISVFFFVWIATLAYQNFSMQYFDFRILIVLYVLLFFSQYMFVKRIREK